MSKQETKHNVRQYAICKDYSMHKAIMGAAPPGMVIDHIDRDGLNNMRSNLRFATPSQNSQNVAKRGGLSSKYLGVTKSKKKWLASCGGTRLGLFEIESEAAQAYDRYVLQKYGKFASTNGILSYDDFISVDVPQVEQVEREKYVERRGDQFFVRFEFEKNYHYLGPFEDELEAVTACATKKAILEVERHERLMSLPIARNAEGIAILVLHDRAGNITGEALVDDENWHQLNLSGWSKTAYGYVSAMISGKTQLMHRYLLEAGDQEIDHINRNKLDNRLSNLRVTDRSNNCQNKAKRQILCHTDFIGVSRLVSGRWTARIRKGDVRTYIGSFDTAIESAMMYNLYALQMYEQPLLNTIDHYVPSNVQDAERVIVDFRVKRDLEAAERTKETIEDDELIGLAAMKIVESRSDTKYRGVYQSSQKRWAAEVRKDGVRYRLGTHTSPEAAAYAYDQKAKELYSDPVLLPFRLRMLHSEMSHTLRDGRNSQARLNLNKFT